MLQATVGDSLSFDPLSLDQDGGAASEVDVGWGEIVDALVVTAVGLVVDRRGGLGFGIDPPGGGFLQGAGLVGCGRPAGLFFWRRVVVWAAQVVVLPVL